MPTPLFKMTLVVLCRSISYWYSTICVSYWNTICKHSYTLWHSPTWCSWSHNHTRCEHPKFAHCEQRALATINHIWRHTDTYVRHSRGTYFWIWYRVQRMPQIHGIVSDWHVHYILTYLVSQMVIFRALLSWLHSLLLWALVFHVNMENTKERVSFSVCCHTHAHICTAHVFLLMLVPLIILLWLAYAVTLSLSGVCLSL
jgi:hypothetical protein